MLCPAYLRHFPEKSLQLLDEAALHLDRFENPPDTTLALFHTLEAMALMAAEQTERVMEEVQTAALLCEHSKDYAVVTWAALTFAVALIELDRYQQAHAVMQAAQNKMRGFHAFFFQSLMLPTFALIFIGLGELRDAHQVLMETLQENRRYTPVVSFDLFLLATAAYLQRTGLQEHAFEMVHLYFQPVLPNLFLHRKAKNLLHELEADFSPETGQSVARRAENWLSESPSSQNPLGLRADFLDYVTRLLQLSIHER